MAKEAKYGFGRLIDPARGGRQAWAASCGVMVVEKHERLKIFEKATSIAAQARPGSGIMDQAIHNKIIRGIGANLGSRSHLTSGSRTYSKKSESPRWR